MLATTYVPSPGWLSAPVTSWRLTAASLAGLETLAGIAVLYCGILRSRWAITTLETALAVFSLVLTQPDEVTPPEGVRRLNSLSGVGSSLVLQPEGSPA